jgi:hypothetical protein
MNLHPGARHACAIALLSGGLGCGAVATPADVSRTDAGSTDAATVPDSGSADAATVPGTAAATGCEATLDAYCATRECPATWADAQSAARRWCTKSYGVRNPQVQVSTRACGGTYRVVVGDGYVGETYVYDATLSSLIAVYRYTDTTPESQCAAGAPAPPGWNACEASVTYLCAGQPLLDAGRD